ncbi:galactose mutarotase-like [Rhynchophorus ferrugineus]|uniref:galactose mutarotase-like n=1 Tax=Rhynchophorus ferrugineus TaxID=354439 RepID=UPI003FCDF803
MNTSIIEIKTESNSDQEANTKKKSSSIVPSVERNFEEENVVLVEDLFGHYVDENGIIHDIKRFTWRNKNKIQVQVINYGARIISIKVPDRKGDVEDIVLGFDDLAGYIHYQEHNFGAVIGRVSGIVKNSSFAIDNKRFAIVANRGPHSINGGNLGFDKIVWDTYISGRKVLMSHVNPNLREGYPGDLLVRVSFELSAKNEFRVSVEAQTTKPTPVDISQLVYLNLAGHQAGPDEIYRHILMLNCNCFTPQVDGIPTGEIVNVVHSSFDFQVPKVLGKVMGIVPKDGFNQNLCVNRGMYQNECFVARLFHPPSGRLLEIYSNQPGVQLLTGNHFGYGNLKSMEELRQPSVQSKTVTVENQETPDTSMILYEKLHEKVVELLALDGKNSFREIRTLIDKIKGIKGQNNNKLDEITVTPMQKEYLVKAREVVCEDEESDDACLDLKETLSAILKVIIISDKEKTSQSTLSNKSSKNNVSKTENSPAKTTPETENDPKLNLKNKIPSYYKNSQEIKGKGRCPYRSHGAIALPTGNYPNAVNIKQFPNCILKPGEVYKHDVTYRFWIRAGNPNRWIKRNLTEAKNTKSL